MSDKKAPMGEVVIGDYSVMIFVLFEWPGV